MSALTFAQDRNIDKALVGPGDMASGGVRNSLQLTAVSDQPKAQEQENF
jgi:hypothetical protein